VSAIKSTLFKIVVLMTSMRKGDVRKCKKKLQVFMS
jgi:hypothetical protein